jgi:hypothetical protein
MFFSIRVSRKGEKSIILSTSFLFYVYFSEHTWYNLIISEVAEKINSIFEGGFPMHDLPKEICDVIDDHDFLTYQKVADLIGSTKQEMSYFHTNKQQFSFRKYLRLSFVVYPGNQKEVMDRWCLRFDSVESVKQSFEYASITRNKELLKELIDKHKGDSSFTKHVAVYTVLYDYYMFKYEADELVNKMEKVGKLSGDLAILSDIIKCYYYYYVEEYHLMLATAKQALKAIHKLSDRQLFIKESFLHRIAEVLGHVSLHLNDIEAARFYANIIINADICAKTVSGAYYILGMTYLTEDKTKCIEYLRERYEIARTLGEESIEKNARRGLDIAKLYLNVQLDADSDPILLRLQNNKGSEFELNLIKEAAFKQGDDGILIILKGIAKNSVKKLHEYRKTFFKQQNYFFASLAAREIQKMDENCSDMIEEFIEFKIETKGDVDFEEDYIKCFNRISDCRRSGISA